MDVHLNSNTEVERRARVGPEPAPRRAGLEASAWSPGCRPLPVLREPAGTGKAGQARAAPPGPSSLSLFFFFFHAPQGLISMR